MCSREEWSGRVFAVTLPLYAVLLGLFAPLTVEAEAWMHEPLSLGPYAISFGFDPGSDIAWASGDAGAWERVGPNSWVLEGIPDYGGTETSLAFAASGTPAISSTMYHGSLKYSRKTPTGWVTETVWSGRSGSTSLAFKSNGLPAISHCWMDRDGGGLHGVEYSEFNGSTWITVDVPGAVSGSTSLALDAADRPWIAFSQVGSSYVMKVAHHTGSSWVVWTVQSQGNNGNEQSLALAPDGRAVVAWIGEPGGVFSGQGYLSRFDGSAWVQDTQPFATNVKDTAALTFDPFRHRPVVAYRGSDDGLWLARERAGGWTQERIRDSAGVYIRMGFDRYGRVGICDSSMFSYESKPLPRFAVTDLGTIGSWSTYGIALNNKGHVAGYEDNGTGQGHGFLWRNGIITALGSLPGTSYSYGLGINDADQMVGESGPVNGGGRAFLWEEGVMTDLGTFDGPAVANKISNDGKAVGSAVRSGFGGYGRRAVLWQGGAITDLGALPGCESAIAYAINSTGDVTGDSFNDFTGPWRAFLLHAGVMTDLGTLPGYPYGKASDINDSGDVVGCSFDSGGSARPVLYANGTVVDLGTLGGGNSYANAINNAGQIVGTSGGRAFLWQAGTLLDLNDLLVDPNSGWVLQQAADINESGQIVGHGLHNGQTRAFILTPVYTLTVSVTHPEWGGVIVEPDLPYYEPNAVVRLTMYKDDNRYWGGWQGDVPPGHEVDNPLVITMDADKEISTAFKCGFGMGSMLPLTGIAMFAVLAARRRKG